MDYLRGKIKGKYSQPPWESYQGSLETPLSPILPLRRNISPLFPRRSTGRREGSEKSRFSSRDRALRSRRESLDNPRIYSQDPTRSSSKNGSDQLHSTYRSSSRIGLDQLHSTYRSSPTSSNYTVDDCTSKYLNYISKYYDKSLNEPERAKQFDQKDDFDSIETLEGVDTYKENSMFDESTGSDNYLKTDISIHDETLNSERGSRLETLCSRCSMSPAPLIEYNPIDYKAMFEKEREEKQAVSEKVQELEGRQKLLEQSIANFLQIRQELRDLNSQAEETDSMIDSIIQEAVPDFGGKRRQTFPDQDDSYNSTRNRLKLFRGGRMDLGNLDQISPTPSRGETCTPVYRAKPAQADPDIPATPSPPPLPAVSYTWDECSTTPSPLSGRYSYSSRIPSRLDELKLNLRYDVTSSLLPTKLQLEIKNKAGQVVFRKRQNLYYVKVQERLSTLDAGQDYIMTVTSISGNIKASEDVTIHNKDYREESYSRSFATPGYDVTDSVTIPYMDTYRSPSESSLTSGFDERSIDSIFDAPLRSMEAAYQETRDATETPVPDLEEIGRWDPQVQSRVHVSEEEGPEKEEKEEEKEEKIEMKSPVEELKKNPFTLHKKPVVPELKYRWQYGFRRGIGSTYQKVPILKLEFKYSESTPLLPSTLSIETKTESRLLPVGPTGAVAEFVFKDGDAQTIHISARDKSGLEHISSPSFRCTPGSLDPAQLGQWFTQPPILNLEI